MQFFLFFQGSASPKYNEVTDYMSKFCNDTYNDVILENGNNVTVNSCISTTEVCTSHIFTYLYNYRYRYLVPIPTLYISYHIMDFKVQMN